MQRISSRNGMMEKTELRSFLQAAGEVVGVREDVVVGLGEYLITKNCLGSLRKQLPAVLQFLNEMKQTMGEQPYYKEHSFRYMAETSQPSERLELAADNARFWVNTMGREFFTRNRQCATQLSGGFYAPIGDEFYLSCKGGSGSGTFCLDFAIGLKEGLRKSSPHELWRTGLDTQRTETGRAGRIIRTGTGVKPNGENYEHKASMFKRFHEVVGIKPPRALALLAMYVAYDLKLDELWALSNEGARTLGTLKNSKGDCHYSELFAQTGFVESANPNWLKVEDLQDGFYDALQTHPGKQSGLRSYESAGLGRVLDACKQLRNYEVTAECPIQVCARETQEELRRAINAFAVIHGKKEPANLPESIASRR